MDSQNVYCVKETRCTWPSVLIRTPLVPRERGAGHPAADEHYYLRSYPIRHSTTQARPVGSSVPDECQTSQRQLPDILSRSVLLSFTCGSTAVPPNKRKMLKSRQNPRSRCIKALSNRFSWTRCILWGEQWNDQSNPLTSRCRRMKRNSEIPEPIPLKYATRCSDVYSCV